jgi:Tol biopolymer transport system component
VALFAAFAAGCGGHGRASGTILFESDRSGSEALYAVRPDGRGTTRLRLDIPADGANVFWSRDGTKALVMDDTGSGGVVASVVEPASHARRKIRLPGLDQASDSPWSPDGKRLVLATNEGDVVMDVKTGRRRQVRDERASDSVAWSGDGKRLLFPAGHDVFAAPAGGGPPVRLMRLPHRQPAGLQSSSDGRWISFEEFGAARTRLYAVRSNGTGLRLISRDAESSVWSPTGERLVFAGYHGIVLVDVAKGRRQRLTRERLFDPQTEAPAWSPDGQGILYWRNDLVYGPAPAYHTQVWTMKADGTDRHSVTHAFPGDGVNASAEWVEDTLKGTPVPRLPLVSLRAARTITTGLPIVALAAEGNRAAVAQGFGGSPALHGPLGPIVVWNRIRSTRVEVPVSGCRTAYDTLLAAGRVGYRCGKPGNDYSTDDTLRLVRPGEGNAIGIAHVHGEEFNGSLLGGLAGDGSAIAFDVGVLATTAQREVHIARSRIWRVVGTRKTIVRAFGGEATVASLDAGRIAVLRGDKAVSVLYPGGGMRTFAFGGARILGAALDGPRLVVLETSRLTVLAVSTGRRMASWPVRRGLGPDPELEGAQGDLAAYVVGVAVRVVRLSDGREFVIDTPRATEPVFARFVPSGLFYAFNESYAKRPGHLLFVPRSELARALASKASAR